MEVCMDLNEIKYHIEMYTQRVNSARNDEEKQMYTNMLNVWVNQEEKLRTDAIAKKNSPDRLAKRLEKLKKNVENLGVEYSVWEEWAHSLYEVTKQGDGSLLVKSNARDWKVDMSWTVDSDLGALEKVYKLVAYKIQDRKRGSGDILRDLGLICKE
jgi:hypothetical protein